MRFCFSLYLGLEHCSRKALPHLESLFPPPPFNHSHEQIMPKNLKHKEIDKDVFTIRAGKISGPTVGRCTLIPKKACGGRGCHV